AGLVEVGFPENLLNFGSGSLFTLGGAMTIGIQHPLAIGFLGIFAIGAAAGAVAGEREAGTLEVLLARPLSRRRLYVSVGVAILVAIGVTLALLLAGQVLSINLLGVADEIDQSQVPLIWVNGMLLWGAFAVFSLAASVSFDRRGPAIGLSLAYLGINYFLEILGSFLPDLAWTQEYSLFHHWNPGEIVTGNLDPFDLALLGVAIVLPVLWALIVFPRRDLAAPG
ncbi:MAG TPA: ABC transporter permease subunit, partial [Pleomorphomonadaceae bacterium]|nr:ABC transporter permease subunit [Pleomorphomonadaceae bacterium]